MLFDTIIIGGGAAGLATAIMLKQTAPTLEIAILEQLDRVGKKISVTGNGRCNITNQLIDISRYHGRHIDRAAQILSAFSLKQTQAFFSSIGVEIVFEGAKGYPRSLQAASVVDTLRFAADRFGVNTFSSVRVTQMQKKGQYFFLQTDNKNFEPTFLKAKTVLIATGGLAGGKALGATGDGYGWLKQFGHHMQQQTPVIVQVKTENTITKSLKGIKVNATASVVLGGQVLASDHGEILFCDYGLSGPPILQLSRYAKNGALISLDLFPERTASELTALLQERREIFKDFPLTEFFAGLLNKRVGQAVLKTCGLSLSQSPDMLTDADCRRIADRLKSLTFSVIGNTGFSNAQATAGGADLSEFTDRLMSKHCSGLFAAGEVLDVDGDCGGFNLQWAWSSASTAAKGIAHYCSRSSI